MANQIHGDFKMLRKFTGAALAGQRGTFAKYAVVGFLAIGTGLVAWSALKPGAVPEQRSIVVPQLSAAAQAGETAFAVNCATCHGRNAAGTDKGPPLVHDIYNPGHHADEAFFLAARYGVRRHHWHFGDMPPQPQVSEEQMRAVVRYVRELQAANGSTYRPHRM